ncbi:MAG: hypothetical protein LASZOEIN_001008 [Candidatus Fervidibacter sp.]
MRCRTMKWFRFAFGISLLALICLEGCGGNDLTGGSVPIGNPSPTRLIGTVVDEDEPSVPLADAEVEIAVEDGTKIVAKTDASGMFVVELPRNKRCTLKVRPPIVLELIYQEQVDEFVTDSDEIRLIVPIPRKGMAAPVFAGLQIHPKEVTLRVRESVKFQVQLEPLPQRPIRPIWSVHGGIGVITPDGLFVATRPGKGVVRVRVGHLHSEATVNVISD